MYKGYLMGLMERMSNGQFVKICEIDPPKGIDTGEFFRTADMLKGRVHNLLVADLPGAVMKMGSLAASFLLKERGFEPIFNLSGRDRNVLALESDILSAYALGIRNLYIVDGVDIRSGDHPNALSVNNVNSLELLSIVKRLREGFDSGGNELTGKPDFYSGIFVNSNAKVHALDLEMSKLEEKIRQEAGFVITPAIFDLKAFEEFIKKVRKAYSIPVIAEVILLKSVATAKFINKHVEGVMVPDAIIERLYSAGDKQAESIAIAVDLIKGLKDLCQGVKIVPLGWEVKVPAVISGVEM